METRWTLRSASAEDLALLAGDVADGFESYLDWAPPGWTPPVIDEASLGRLATRLARSDVWCLLALDGDAPAGHIALSPVTGEEPEPPPPGAIYLWQCFVRRRWHGSGVASRLIAAAVLESQRRGYTQIRLWTPRGAGRARRFYDREGWTLTGRAHERSPTGLPTVEYARITAAS